MLKTFKSSYIIVLQIKQSNVVFYRLEISLGRCRKKTLWLYFQT